MFISETGKDCYETKYVKLGCDNCSNLTLLDISFLQLNMKRIKSDHRYAPYIAMYYCNVCNTYYALVQTDNDSCTQMLEMIKVEVAANER